MMKGAVIRFEKQDKEMEEAILDKRDQVQFEKLTFGLNLKVERFSSHVQDGHCRRKKQKSQKAL